MTSKLALLSVLTTSLALTILSCDNSTSPEDEEPDKNLPIAFTHEIVTDELVKPWQLDFSEDGRIFISEIEGQIRIVEDGELVESPWYDFNELLSDSGESYAVDSGLQGLSLDPNFENNGYVYAAYAYDAPDKPYDLNKLVRLKENPSTEKR